MLPDREWTKRDRALVAAIFCAAAALLFVRLDDRYLWQDEAETALLAESVLRHGIPTAWDGRNLISQEEQQEFDRADFRWFWTPWLQHYVTATSFLLFGPSTFAARLPFVLFGLATLWACYLLALRSSGSRSVAAGAMLLLATSVPFLLHVRQCRYYALACFFGILFLIGYHRVLSSDRDRSSVLLLVAAATGLFHSHYVVFAGFALGLAIHFVAIGGLGVPRRRSLVDMAIAAGIMISLAAPFLLGFGSRSTVQALPGWSKSWATLREALIHVDLYVLPASLMLVWVTIEVFDAVRNRSVRGELAGAGVVDPEHDPDSEHGSRDLDRPILLLALVMISTVALLALLMPWFFFRYYVALLPVGAVLAALAVAGIARRWPPIGVPLIVLLAMTDLASGIHPFEKRIPAKSVRHLRTGDERPSEVVGAWASFMPMAAYLFEVGHERTGPIEEAVRVLREHASPEETILVTYGDLPIQFYTDLKVVGGLSGENPADYRSADWLFVRAHTHRGGDARLKRFISRSFDSTDFEIVKLGVPDVPYENRPDPTYHKFRTPTEGLPEARLWRRRVD